MQPGTDQHDLDPGVIDLTDDAGPGATQQLLAAARAGSVSAFALLYELHRPRAERKARQVLTGSHRVMVEDVVEVAFASVFDAMRNGAGPVDHFDRYLVTAVKHEAWRQQRRREREPFLGGEDLDRWRSDAVATDPERPDLIDLTAEEAVEALDAEQLIVRAYAEILPRHRAVIWMAEVEGLDATDIAAALDLTPNSAAALTYRARRSLRTAYFASYRDRMARPECAALVAQLQAYVEAKPGAEGFAAIEAHLEGCATCRDVLRGVTQPSPALVLAGVAALSSARWFASGAAAPSTPAPAGASGGTVHARGAPARRRPRPRVPRSVVVSASAAAAVVAVVVAAIVLRSGPSEPPEAAAPERAAVAGATSSSPAVPPPADDLTPAVPGIDRPAPTLGSVEVQVDADPDADGPRSVEPASGVVVELTGEDGAVVRRTTDRRGTARFDGMAAGSHRPSLVLPVGASVDGSVPVSSAGRSTASLPAIEVAPGATASRSVRLVPWRRLSVEAGAGDASGRGSSRQVGWPLTLASEGAPTSDVELGVRLGPADGLEVVQVQLDLGGGDVRTCTVGPWVARCPVGRVGDAPQRARLLLTVVGRAGAVVDGELELTSPGYAAAGRGPLPAVELGS